MLNGTSTAPILVSAIAICAHRTPFGMINPTRLPFVTPAAAKPTASSDVVSANSA